MLRSLLKKISLVADGPVVTLRSFGQGLVMGAQDAEMKVADYRSWRFALCAKSFRGNYFEYWNSNGKDAFSLYRAYLNIYQMKCGEEAEFLCLHTDPQEPNSSHAAKYKRGPHFHISVAGDPFKHAHIALNHQFLPSVLKTPQTLTHAFQCAIQMIRDEILSQFEPSDSAAA